MLVAVLSGIAVLNWSVVLLDGVKHKEKNYEDMVSHRSAVRCNDLRDGPDFTAGNVTRCRAERRSSASCHVSACPCDGAAGGGTRGPTRATPPPPRGPNPCGPQPPAHDFPRPQLCN